jgi:hypothetical protein
MTHEQSHINESFYLCEGIWLDTEQKTLVDQRDSGKTLDINKFEDQVLIFEREVREWIFSPMTNLVCDDIKSSDQYLPFKNAIFILFGIFSYVEKIQRYKAGRPYIGSDLGSAGILKDGFMTIFSNTSSRDKIDNILEYTRHTLMHMGMVGDKVLLNYGAEKDIEHFGSSKNIECIKINPRLALITLDNDFNQYLDSLRNHSANEELVDNFTKVFANIYKNEIDLLSNQL